MLRKIATLLLLAAGITGCPLTWGKGGSIEKAAGKDMAENSREASSRGQRAPPQGRDFGVDSGVEKKICPGGSERCD